MWFGLNAVANERPEPQTENSESTNSEFFLQFTNCQEFQE